MTLDKDLSSDCLILANLEITSPFQDYIIGITNMPLLKEDRN